MKITWKQWLVVVIVLGVQVVPCVGSSWTGSVSNDWMEAGNWTNDWIPFTIGGEWASITGNTRSVTLGACLDGFYHEWYGYGPSVVAFGSGGGMTITDREYLGGPSTVSVRNIVLGSSGMGTLYLQGRLSCRDAFLARQGASSGLAEIYGEHALWDINGELYVGGGENPLDFGGTGTVEVTAGGSMVSFGAKIGVRSAATGTVTVSGAGSSWDASEHFFGIPEEAPDTYFYVGLGGRGTLNVTSGGQIDSQLAYIGYEITGNGNATVEGATSTWNVTGDLTVGRDGFGVLSIRDGGHVSVDDAVSFQGSGELLVGTGVGYGEVSLHNGSLTTQSITIGAKGSWLWTGGGTVTIVEPCTFALPGEFNVPSGGELIMSGAVDGRFLSEPGSRITPNGDLALGDAASYAACTLGGVLDVADHTVTLNSKRFTNLGEATTLAGGTLVVPNGAGLSMGDALVGHGEVNARVAAALGSTIAAEGGDLTLGDGSPVGFTSHGELYVNDNTVTILDANQAVLGSLTQLGSDATDGTLVADNGLLVEFGKSIVGRGTVNTPDDSLLPLTNNGVITGDSETNKIELTGYVKGVGMLENVTVSGTLSPGFSPVRLHATNLEIGSSGELVMELGGLSGGSEYDQLEVVGDLTLGGALQVVLIDGFVPGVGDMFDILDFNELNGTKFASLELPGLVGRKAWDTSELYTNGEISVIGMLDGDTDADWDVDSVDLANLEGVFGGEGDLYTDLNGDGRVDLEDFAIMRDNFGLGLPSAPDAELGAATPEPATLGMLTLGGLSLVRRRKRRACK